MFYDYYNRSLSFSDIERYLLWCKTRKEYETVCVIVEPLEYDIKMYMAEKEISTFNPYIIHRNATMSAAEVGIFDYIKVTSDLATDEIVDTKIFWE